MMAEWQVAKRVKLVYTGLPSPRLCREREEAAVARGTELTSLTQHLHKGSMSGCRSDQADDSGGEDEYDHMMAVSLPLPEPVQPGGQECAAIGEGPGPDEPFLFTHDEWLSDEESGTEEEDLQHTPPSPKPQPTSEQCPPDLALAHLEIHECFSGSLHLPEGAGDAWIARCGACLSRLHADPIAYHQARLALLERFFCALALGAWPSPVVITLLHASTAAGHLPAVPLLKRLNEAIEAEAHALGLRTQHSTSTIAPLRQSARPCQRRLQILLNFTCQVLPMLASSQGEDGPAQPREVPWARERAISTFVGLLCEVAAACRAAPGGTSDARSPASIIVLCALREACSSPATVYALSIAQVYLASEWRRLLLALSYFRIAPTAATRLDHLPPLIRRIASLNGQNWEGPANSFSSNANCTLPSEGNLRRATETCVQSPVSQVPILAATDSCIGRLVLGQSRDGPLASLIHSPAWSAVFWQLQPCEARPVKEVSSDVHQSDGEPCRAVASAHEVLQKPVLHRCDKRVLVSEAIQFSAELALRHPCILPRAHFSNAWSAMRGFHGADCRNQDNISERFRLTFTHAASLPTPPMQLLAGIRALADTCGARATAQLLWNLTMGDELCHCGTWNSDAWSSDRTLHLGVVLLCFVDSKLLSGSPTAQWPTTDNRAQEPASLKSTVNSNTVHTERDASQHCHNRPRILSCLIERVWRRLLPTTLTDRNASRAALIAHLIFALVAHVAEAPCDHSQQEEDDDKHTFAPTRSSTRCGLTRLLSTLVTQLAILLETTFSHSLTTSPSVKDEQLRATRISSPTAILSFCSLFSLLGIRHAPSHLYLAHSRARCRFALALSRCGHPSLSMAWINFGDSKEAQWARRLTAHAATSNLPTH